MKKKQTIQVRRYHAGQSKYGSETIGKITGNFGTFELVDTVRRVLRVESTGNFLPVYCTYKGEQFLVHSETGDLSDPFRANETYLENLFIELPRELAGAKIADPARIWCDQCEVPLNSADLEAGFCTQCKTTNNPPADMSTNGDPGPLSYQVDPQDQCPGCGALQDCTPDCLVNRPQNYECTFDELLLEYGGGWDNPDELLARLFEMAGATPTAQVTMDSVYYPKPADRLVPLDGWAVYLDLDDFSAALYRDGQPVCGFYQSTRGHLQQSGGYLADGDRHFYSHNMPGVDGRSQVINRWEPTTPNCIDARIARDFLLGEDPMKCRSCGHNPCAPSCGADQRS